MTKKPSPPIDLNSAGEKELVKKLNISTRLAKRIIALRPYQSVDQLKMVWGIDPEVLQRILPVVTVLHKEEITPELSTDEIPNPVEKPVLPKGAEQKPEISLQNVTIQKEELVLQEEADEPANQPGSFIPLKAAKASWKISLALVLILIAGAYFQFTGLIGTKTSTSIQTNDLLA